MTIKYVCTDCENYDPCVLAIATEDDYVPKNCPFFGEAGWKIMEEHDEHENPFSIGR